MKLSYKLKIVAVIAIACVVALKAYDKQNVNVSDVVLANVEALADKSEIDNGGVGGIVCSAKCNDGIGRCWIDTGKTCIFSGYMVNMCSNLPCVSSSDGPI